MVVREENDGSFSIYGDDKRVLKTGINSNSEAWRLADKMDPEAIDIDERHSQISSAIRNW